MYKIEIDDKTLWTPSDSGKKLVSPKLSLAVNSVGSLSFTIYPDHSAYNAIEKMRPIITVKQDNNVLFKGRIYSDNMDFHKAKKVEVEGILGYFNDSIVRPYTFTGSVEAYLLYLINQHNAQVPTDKEFKLGVVTVRDANDYIVRESSDYPSTWTEIGNKLINNLGGYITIRYEDDGNYIDYFNDFTAVSSQKIEYAVNLMDLTNEVNAQNLTTCLVPLGASINVEGSDGSKRLTIESVNDGKDYIVNEELEKTYGRITKIMTWDDVTEPANLLRKGKAYLDTMILLEGTLTIKAVDLHMADDRIEAFRIGQYIGVVSEPHDLNETLLLSSYDVTLSDPTSFVATLGRVKESFTSTYSSNSAKAEANVSNTVAQKLSVYDRGVQFLAGVMANSMGMYITEQTTANGGKIVYQHDRPLLSESLTIWKKSEEGFAVSLDGGKTWTGGMTADGNAILNVLSVHGIKADWINADNLSAISANIGGWKIGNQAIYKDIIDPNDRNIVYRVYFQPPLATAVDKTWILSCQKSTNGGSTFTGNFILYSDGSARFGNTTISADGSAKFGNTTISKDGSITTVTSDGTEITLDGDGLYMYDPDDTSAVYVTPTAVSAKQFSFTSINGFDPHTGYVYLKANDGSNKTLRFVQGILVSVS